MLNVFSESRYSLRFFQRPTVSGSPFRSIGLGQLDDAEAAATENALNDKSPMLRIVVGTTSQRIQSIQSRSVASCIPKVSKRASKPDRTAFRATVGAISWSSLGNWWELMSHILRLFFQDLFRFQSGRSPSFPFTPQPTLRIQHG